MEFKTRLEHLMDHYDLSATSFAQAIGVGRSSISHILSGRNRPSLEFVMKITEAFPEVELSWLLDGKGDLPNKKSILKSKTAVATAYPEPQIQSAVDLFSQSDFSESESETRATLTKSQDPSKRATKPSKAIDRIVVFYSDGTFDAYRNPGY